MGAGFVLLLRNFFVGIPWQAWVASIFLAAFAVTGYALHRKIVDIEVQEAKDGFRKGLEAANSELDKAIGERNIALEALDTRLHAALNSSNEATAIVVRQALERINARLKDEPDPYCMRCFSPADDLRITRVPKR